MSSVFGNALSQGAPGRPGSEPERGGSEPDWEVVMLSHLASMERELRRMRSYMPMHGRQFVASDGNESVESSKATLTTALAGANNDLTFTADVFGAGGNAIRITYVVAGLNTALSVAVAGNDITVNVATDGAGAATSTAALVLAALNASAPAAALIDTALASGNDGTGIVTAMAFTNLAGGGVGGGGYACKFEGPRSGNDWYVERVTLSAGGASAAGVACLYAGSVIDESNLLDCLGALTGNSPSRGVLDGDGTPYFVYGGAGLLVNVSGVVPGQPVQVRLQGREVLAGADPALREQSDY